jgi:TPR repeat protein
MPMILLKSVAGLFAGVAVGALSLAYWPQIQPTTVAARLVVEQPQRVVQAAPPALEKSAVDKLALALRDVQPDAAAADFGPTRGLTLAPSNVDFSAPSDDARRFRAQGLVALAGGDVAAARAFLERAADAGDARSLLVLGDAYDPATLTRLGAVGLKGDASRARDYYQRANDAGLAVARQRIAAYEVSQ